MLKKLLRTIKLALFGADEAVCTCGEDLKEADLGYAEWHAQGGCWRHADNDSFGVTTEEWTTEKIFVDGECPF
jgi:hypothetical protein